MGGYIGAGSITLSIVMPPPEDSSEKGSEEDDDEDDGEGQPSFVRGDPVEQFVSDGLEVREKLKCVYASGRLERKLYLHTSLALPQLRW
jgi:hypothetical protein